MNNIGLIESAFAMGFLEKCGQVHRGRQRQSYITPTGPRGYRMGQISKPTPNYIKPTGPRGIRKEDIPSPGQQESYGPKEMYQKRVESWVTKPVAEGVRKELGIEGDKPLVKGLSEAVAKLLVFYLLESIRLLHHIE